MSSTTSISVDARDLSAAEGLLILVTRALDKLKTGDVLEIVSDNASAQHDPLAWARHNSYRWLGTMSTDGRWRHLIEKGSALRVLTDRELDWDNHAPIKDGRFDTKHWLLGHAAGIQQIAQRSSGFAPRGAIVEKGS